MQAQQAAEVAAREKERAQMEEDGVVTATDPASVDDGGAMGEEELTDVLETQTVAQSEASSMSLVFSLYKPKKVCHGCVI